MIAPLALLLTGCIPDPDQGTAVGNPTILALRLSDGDGVDFTEATATADYVRLTNPEDLEILAEDKTVNLIAETSIYSPVGDWTGLTLQFAGGITLSTAELSRDIPVDRLAVVGVFSTATPLILQLGGSQWIDPETWEEGEAGDIAELFSWGTALYEDADGDTLLDAEEESAGAVACERCEDEEETATEDDEDDEGDDDDDDDDDDDGNGSGSSSDRRQGDDSRRAH